MIPHHDPLRIGTRTAIRLIAATAMHHGARLVTADATLRALKTVQTVW